MPRNFWKGYLKLSLVTCPVAMLPATSEAEKVRFRTLNRATGNPVEGRYVDAVTGKVVAEDDQVRGYERDDDDHVILEEDELASVSLESTRTIEIEKFVPRDEIEWLWYDTPSYLVPDGAVGEEAFAVIREAMAATDTVGFSRVVLYRRERAVMLEPRDRGIVLWTLRYGDEVRPPKDYFTGIDEAVEPEMLNLVTKLIKKRTVTWSGELVQDPVQDNLREIIANKQKKRPAARAKPERAEKPTNVVNIMDALKKSLAADKGKPT